MVFLFRQRLGGILNLITQLVVVAIWIGWLYNLVGAFRLVIQEDRRLGRDVSILGCVLATMVCLWALAGAAGTLFWFVRQFQHTAANIRFGKWLKANEEKIRNNELVFYRSKRITMKTVLVRHHLVCSAVFFSGRMTTRWLVLGQEPRLRHAWGASLYSFWNGWWGFPFGLIWTPIAIAKNLSGNSTALVEDLLRVPPPPPRGFKQGMKVATKQVTEDLFITN